MFWFTFSRYQKHGSTKSNWVVVVWVSYFGFVWFCFYITTNEHVCEKTLTNCVIG